MTPSDSPGLDGRLAVLVGRVAEAVGRRGFLDGHQDASALIDLLSAEYPSTAPSQFRGVVDGLEEDFGLSGLDTELLVVAGAAELDVRFGALFGLLLDSDRLWPTAGLALELCGQSSTSGAARRRLGPAAPLRRHGVLSLEGSGPLLLQSLRVPERVVAHLLGDRSLDPQVGALLVEAPSRLDDAAQQLARAFDAGVGIGHVRARPGTAGLASARGAWQLLDMPCLLVDLGRRAPAEEPAAAVRTAAREAGLLGCGLVLVGADAAVVADRTVLAAAEQAPMPVVVVDDVAWPSGWVRGPTITVEATDLTLDERATLWKDAPVVVPGDDPAWQSLLGLRMTPQDIVTSVRTATIVAAAQGQPLGVEHLHEAARNQATVRLGGAAVRTVPQATLADLVLPGATRQALTELVSWARHREALLGSGHLTGKGSKGRGLTALFSGSPGTGKTLAAEAVAGELGLELCTVDLSTVVDKYVGETEKRLDQVIGEAENLNVVLFFDEADALFGSRSAVSDARDRYANQEVSYLLQRIERLECLAILATNLRGNLDPAFTRRLHHVITFGDPDAPTRRLLWEAHLREVAADPGDPIDVEWLGDTLEIAGGDIRNVVMAAAFAAAGEQRPAVAGHDRAPVGMRHIRRAAEREFTKLARRPPPGLGAALSS